MRSLDVPQANRLPALVALVQGVHEGRTDPKDLSELTGLASRHVGYYLHAARILGLVDLEAGPAVTDRGRALAETRPDSSDRAQRLIDAIRDSPFVQELVGDLFQPNLTIEEVSQRIVEAAGLSTSTARRRAGTLMRWRAELLDHSAASVPPSIPTPTPPPALDDSSLPYLRNQLRQARLILFTGAGFSADALDLDGRAIPTGSQLARDIWSLCFPDDPFEESSNLQDLYAHARNRHPRQLEDLLRRRLSVDATTLPEQYQVWFSAPWRRVYTLNVDNIEEATARQYTVPRGPLRLSALDNRSVPDPTDPSRLLVVHLNGSISDGFRGMTFSEADYATRLANQEPWYAHLASDLLVYPFVFVGTPLNEPLFWKHLVLRGTHASRETREQRPRSFLVTPELDRARREALRQYNIELVEMTAAQFAEHVLSDLQTDVIEGLDLIARTARSERDDVANVQDVSEVARGDLRRDTDYLLGAEPTWSDLQSGRAIHRSADESVAGTVRGMLTESAARDRRAPAPAFVISGTAGSGKSTTLMRLALTLSSDGHRVAWVHPESEVSPRTLREYADSSTCAPVLAIDDADRYGMEMPHLVRDLLGSEHLKLLLLAIPSPALDRLEGPVLQDFQRPVYHMEPLSDPDIGGLIDALEREHRLGCLRGLPRIEQEAAFRERAGRMLLVAMIEATSGRRFDEKVMEEWRGLPDKSRYFYTLVCLATTLRGYVAREDLLLAAQSSTPEDVDAISLLDRRHIIRRDNSDGRMRARHRVIADKLISELSSEGALLRNAYRDLAYAIALRVGPELRRGDRRWRMLKQLIQHERLFKRLDLDGAREVYETLEQHLGWDYHYWLQRGSLELEEGDIRRAENFLNQALNLGGGDHLVETAHAYMTLKKACANPVADEAETWAEEGLDRLRTQISLRGTRDHYPYHVLGAQGLSWSRRCGWGDERRKDLVRDLLRSVREGVGNHPRQQTLIRLRRDLEYELHRFAVV